MDLPDTRGKGLRIPTRAWSDIEEFYLRSAQDHGYGEEMAELVRHIRSAGYADRLFAFTSMHELIVGLYPELERDVEALHVLYDDSSSSYRLRYYAAPARQPEVERLYPKEIGLKKFDDFVGYLNW